MMIKYLVVCSCSGHIDPVAYINDDRAAGGHLTAWSVRSGDTQTVTAPRTIDGEPLPQPLVFKTIAKEWEAHNVSTTVWEGGNFTWAIRCAKCAKNAVMSDVTFATIADALAKTLGTRAVVPDADGELCYLIPLNVLCSRLSHS
jgi:hypothetical protein